MKCINEKCENRTYCENIHNLNDLKINENTDILIPNRLFFELNRNNRLAKTGIPIEGFAFGCFKIIPKNNNAEVSSLYINDNHITDFELMELIEMSNNAFREMIRSGEIGIG